MAGNGGDVMHADDPRARCVKFQWSAVSGLTVPAGTAVTMPIAVGLPLPRPPAPRRWWRGGIGGRGAAAPSSTHDSVHTSESVLMEYSFTVDYPTGRDIELSILLREEDGTSDDGHDVVLRDAERVRSVHDSLRVSRAVLLPRSASPATPPALILLFRLSNEYSWLTDKSISYNIVAWVPPTEEEADAGAPYPPPTAMTHHAVAAMHAARGAVTNAMDVATAVEAAAVAASSEVGRLRHALATAEAAALQVERDVAAARRGVDAAAAVYRERRWYAVLALAAPWLPSSSLAEASCASVGCASSLQPILHHRHHAVVAHPPALLPPAVAAAGAAPLPGVTASIVGKEDVATALYDYLRAWQGRMSEAGTLHIGVAGGSLLTTLAKALQMDHAGSHQLQYDRWRVWYVDERHVPFDHPDSNHGALLSALTAMVPGLTLAAEPVHTTLPPSQAAEEYASRMWASVPPSTSHTPGSTSHGFPSFHLLLVGMGEDGHVASMFPGHPLLHNTTTPTAYLTDSPKPPPTRVTVTMPVFHAAKQVCFVVTGAGKGDALATFLHRAGDGQGAHTGLAFVPPSTGAAPVPAAMVAATAAPDSHPVHFLLDTAAAARAMLQ